MGLTSTRYRGVYRRKSAKGRKYDTFTARVYDPSRASQQRWLGSFSTAEEARRAKEEFEQRRRRFPHREELTIAQFAEDWLEKHPRSESTMNTYTYAVGPFVAEFGDRRLTDLTKREVREWAIGVPFSQVRVARTMMSDALRDDLIESNPFYGLRLTKGEGRRHQRPPTYEEVMELVRLAAEQGHSYSEILAAAIEFGFGTLMRPGEICAFSRSAIDLDSSILNVEHGIDRFGRLRPPKRGSVGQIAFTPTAKRAVRRLDEILPDERERLLQNTRGEPLRTQTLERWWREFRGFAAGRMRRADLKDMDLYLVTRHAGATFMRNELGISREDIEAQLRHKGPQLIDLYTHPDSAPAIRRILEAWPD